MDQLDKFVSQRLKGSLYQTCALLLLGLANLINGAFLLITSVAVPEIQAEYGLSTAQVSLLSAMFQVGLILGSTLGGEVAKLLGRALSIKLFLLVQLAAGLAVYLCSNFRVACALYTAFGVYNGFAVNVLSAYASEVADFRARGRWMVFVNGFLTLGRVAGALLAFFLLQKGVAGSWKRLVLCLTAGVAVLLPLVVFTLKEPLRFLLVGRRLGAFRQTFNAIAGINNLGLGRAAANAPVSAEAVAGLARDAARLDARQEQGSYRALLSRKFARTNLLVWTLWFGSFVTIFGQSAILPFWFGTAARGLGSVVLVMAAELPVILAGLCLIDRPSFGRIRGLQLTNLLAAVFFLCSLLVERDDLMTGLFLLTRFGVKGVFLFLIPYTAEIYPTPLRSRGLGLGGAAGGLAAVAMPFVLFPLFNWNRYSIFVFLGGVALLCFVASLALSVETTRKSLDIDHDGPGQKHQTGEPLLAASEAHEP